MNRPKFRIMLMECGVKPNLKGVLYMMDMMELMDDQGLGMEQARNIVAKRYDITRRAVDMAVDLVTRKLEARQQEHLQP